MLLVALIFDSLHPESDALHEVLASNSLRNIRVSNERDIREYFYFVFEMQL